MIILVYIILVFTLIQFVTVGVNLIFRQKLKYTDNEFNPLISVLIPARNEEDNIYYIIEDLQNQLYKRIEIIVFDDNSTDKTAQIVSEKIKTDKRITLLQSNDLPNKWLGKNWACHNLAKNAKGDYFLFLDADVRLKQNAIEKTTKFIKKYRLSLMSVFPKQVMKTAGEKLTVPLMHYILLTLLPLILVRISPFKSHSAANGQFMFFQSTIYKKYLPHKLFKDEKVEDIKISRFYKAKKERIACIAGYEEITCRMYSGFKEAVDGFSKNIVMFFGNFYIVSFLFWLITTLGWLPVLLYAKQLFIIYIIIYVLITIFSSIIANQNIFENLILLIPHKFVMLLILVKSLNKKKEWKGRLV